MVAKVDNQKSWKSDILSWKSHGNSLLDFCGKPCLSFPQCFLYQIGIVEAYKGTRRKHNVKFRQIGHTTSQYGQSFFPKTISAWNGLAFAEAPSLAVFRSNFIIN